jgi:hypothetical protein
MEERLKLSRDNTAADVDVTMYWRIIGRLRYLVNTWPDLASSVGYVSRFVERPIEEHMAAVKRILRYVAGTPSLSCHYGRTGEARLIEYSDSDLDDDVDTRKCTSGGLFFYGNSLVSWHALKQKVVALSSCEAEYVAAITAATQAVWLGSAAWRLQGKGHQQCRAQD